MSDKINFGKEGEEKATKYLESIGYYISERNYRCKSGEIDIIAFENETICFIEVKSRHNINYGRPCEAVDHKKQSHIRKAADYYLLTNIRKFPISEITGRARNDAKELDIRFDIIEIIEWTGFNTTEMEHIINAF